MTDWLTDQTVFCHLSPSPSLSSCFCEIYHIVSCHIGHYIILLYFTLVYFTLVYYITLHYAMLRYIKRTSHPGMKKGERERRKGKEKGKGRKERMKEWKNEWMKEWTNNMMHLCTIYTVPHSTLLCCTVISLITVPYRTGIVLTHIHTISRDELPPNFLTSWPPDLLNWTDLLPSFLPD